MTVEELEMKFKGVEANLESKGFKINLVKTKVLVRRKKNMIMEKKY